MEDIKIIQLDETDSTNRFLCEYTGEEGRFLTVATADYQTAGCGQGSNTWESERGKNLLFSMMFRTKSLPAARQFGIIESSALAVAHSLGHSTTQWVDREDGFSIKWPNDIYWHDRKIAGILSECEVRGGIISRCIVGIGINIGQTEFKSDAPNPVSLSQITGKPFTEKRLASEKKRVLEDVAEWFLSLLTAVKCGYTRHYHTPYLEGLYRREGVYEFEDADSRFRASIETVEPDGRLVLRRDDGCLSRYAFKEVSYII